MTPLDYLHKNWLLFGILSCICVAGIYPEFGSKNGPLNTEFTVKYCATTTIFFITGLSLKLQNIYYALSRYDIHLFIQTFTFVLIPLLVQILVGFLQIFNVNVWILKGLITVACMPPPVSSAVILTRTAGGNEIVAIFNSILGSYLGIIVTPLLLLFNLGITSIIPITITIINLTLTILLPLCLGVVVRNCLQNFNFFKYNSTLNLINQCCLLFIIYTTFCDTFQQTETNIDALDIILTIIFIIILQILLLNLAYFLAKSFKNYFNESDIIAIIFCSTHKSLTLGLPVLRLLYHGYSHLSQISLPLLVYHPIQIILGGLMVTQLKDWVQKRYKLPT